ncbi:MAG TPA: adenylyl-sulfate kinase, partial [Nitrospirae bacterium]|nr:adenylyl-sulfate kinase [Nitrospirota bacterium]
FISPFRKDRDIVRNMVKDGDFIEIYCDCSIEICEKRDVKGAYARARKGEIPEFTGISSPYEEPETPELIIDTGNTSLEESVRRVIEYLKDKIY